MHVEQSKVRAARTSKAEERCRSAMSKHGTSPRHSLGPCCWWQPSCFSTTRKYLFSPRHPPDATLTLATGSRQEPTSGCTMADLWQPSEKSIFSEILLVEVITSIVRHCFVAKSLNENVLVSIWPYIVHYASFVGILTDNCGPCQQSAIRRKCRMYWTLCHPPPPTPFPQQAFNKFLCEIIDKQMYSILILILWRFHSRLGLWFASPTRLMRLHGVIPLRVDVACCWFGARLLKIIGWCSNPIGKEKWIESCV